MFGVLSSFPDLYFTLSNQVVMKKKKRLNPLGMYNLRASEACEADVRGTQVSLKSTLVSLNSTQVSLNSSLVSLTVSSLCWGLFMPRMPRLFCSCLARLARLPRMPRWLAYCIH